MENRAGIYVEQSTEYAAFYPKPLPPEPRIIFDDELIKLLSESNRELGRLDGAAEVLPDPDLFVAMYVKKEAVLSSQIEGTQASLVDLLEYRNEEKQSQISHDVGEVVNYVKAMNYGLERLNTLPLSLRLIREIHAVLLEGTRGGERNPGEFRRTQNWIGPPGCTLKTASFVPPPVEQMKQAMYDLETFMHNNSSLPLLVKVGLVHAQFETVHPFLDGNGRMGRLLITFLLCQQKALNRPLLYLSYYFKKHRMEYYEWLMKVRNKGDWEGWLKFYLQGIIEVSKQGIKTARKILDLQSNHRNLIMNIKSTNANKLLDYIYTQPILTINDVVQELEISYPTANTLVSKFCEIGLLKERTGQQRNKVFSYVEYLNILED